MTKYIAKQLLEKYIAGTCTPEEEGIVESWHLQELGHKTLEPDADQLENAHKNIWTSIDARSRKNFVTPIFKRPGYRYAAAAMVTFALSAALFFFIQQNNKHPTVKELLVKTGKDFVPGGNKAVLTLADGSKISLTDAANGDLLHQSGITITKAADGQLIYKIDDKNVKAEQSEYNTIATPRGGKYQIDLPDGSRVWLNSASSLKYPMAFKNSKRKVELTGEAYFEVAKSKQPFIVATATQEVEVLGTHFNVSSYADESSTTTTLIEGKVKVSAAREASNTVILAPGEQSLLAADESLSVRTADIDSEMAWKNDLFVFKGESIQSITRKLSRWYDVEFSFEGNPSNLSYVGMVSRSKNISSVLSIMEGAGNVHFKINGRKITIVAKL